MTVGTKTLVKVKEKVNNLKDWIPVRPSAEGCPPEGDLLIRARSHKVGPDMKVGMEKRGDAREGWR